MESNLSETETNLLLELNNHSCCYFLKEKAVNIVSSEGIRLVFESILEIWGNDFSSGFKIWDLYLDFENKYAAKNSSEENKKNIRNIYKRRLSFPHIDNDIIFSEYKKWEVDPVESEANNQLFSQSSLKIKTMISIEERFNEILDNCYKTQNTQEILDFLRKNLKETTKNNTNYLRLFYERSIEINANDELLWSSYLEDVKAKKVGFHSKKKFNSVYIQLLKRCCKMCYGSVKFWIYLFREMEKQGFSSQEISNKISEAYVSTNDSFFKFEIWKYSLEFYCRCFNDYDVEILTSIRKNFELAVEEISLTENKLIDKQLIKIYSIWAEFETYKSRDLIKH